MSSTPCLGFIGLGTIGLPIAENLIAAGFELQVHTRSRIAEKDKCLKQAKSCSSPYEAAKNCDVLLVCVSNDEAVEMVLFGQHGAQDSLKEGSIVLDLSTISPAKSKSFSSRLKKKKITYVDAPVTGGSEGAKSGSLTIFLGADEKMLDELHPILNSIGSSIFAFGEVGKGQQVKAINQVLVAGNYAAVAEAIALGQQLDLPMEQVIDSLQKGAANSWALTNRSKNMVENNFPLGFKLSLHHKDLCIAIKTAEESGLNLQVTKKVKEIEESLIKEGYQDYDISVLRKYLDKSNI